MIGQHPYRAVGAVVSVMAVSLTVSALIGQFNDGPWGGLPSWLGAVAWFTFLGSLLVLLALGTSLAAGGVRSRRAAR